MSAFVAALYVPSSLTPEAGAERLVTQYEGLRRYLEPGGLEEVVTAEQVRRVVSIGAVGVLWAVENGRPLGLSGVLEKVVGWGVRYVTATHLESHEWCDAAGADEIHRGLSDGGVRLVREMKRRGVLLDVSHASDDAVLHALDALRSPIIASHSCARSLCDLPRNLSDSLGRDIARWGGVVMVNSYPAFVSASAAEVYRRRLAKVTPWLSEDLSPAELEARVAEVLEADPLPAVPLSSYVDHILHWVEVVGEEHVGLGTDFDGISETLEGFEDVRRFPDLMTALRQRGLPPAAIRGIAGENFLRVLAAAERISG